MSKEAGKDLQKEPTVKSKVVVPDSNKQGKEILTQSQKQASQNVTITNLSEIINKQITTQMQTQFQSPAFAQMLSDAFKRQVDEPSGHTNNSSGDITGYELSSGKRIRLDPDEPESDEEREMRREWSHQQRHDSPDYNITNNNREAFDNLFGNDKDDVNEDSEEEDDFIAELKSLTLEDADTAIGTKLRDTLKSLWIENIPAEQRKSIYDKIKVPKNCQFLRVPKLNSVIHDHIRSDAQTRIRSKRDMRLQSKQKLIASAAIPITQAIDQLVEIMPKKRKFNQPLLQLNYDKAAELRHALSGSFICLSIAYSNLDLERKDSICYALGRNFKRFKFEARSTNDEETDLFSEKQAKDMMKQLKTEKTAQSSSYRSRQEYQSTSQRNNYRNNYRKPSGYNNYKYQPQAAKNYNAAPSNYNPNYKGKQQYNNNNNNNKFGR